MAGVGEILAKNGWCTQTEAAHVMGVSEQTVMNRRQAGLLRTEKFGSRRYYSLADCHFVRDNLKRKTRSIPKLPEELAADGWITLKEAAVLAEVPYSKMIHWRARGFIPSKSFGDRQFMVHRDDVLARRQPSKKTEADPMPLRSDATAQAHRAA